MSTTGRVGHPTAGTSRIAQVVMFVYNDATHDSRVLREAESLIGEGYRVTLFAVAAPGLPSPETRGGAEILRVPPPWELGQEIVGGSAVMRKLRKFRWLMRYAFAFMRWRRASIELAAQLMVRDQPVYWHGHDLTGLAVAAGAQNRYGGLLVYDSHELYLGTATASGLPWPLRRAMAALEARLARRANLVITVNEKIASELNRRYGIDPVVVMNCPPAGPKPVDRDASPLRADLRLGDRVVVLYHGNVHPTKVRSLLDAMPHLDPDWAVVLLGTNANPSWLRTWSADPRYTDRLFTHPPVAIRELPRWIAGADVGVLAFWPDDLNHVLSTPNKLFECLSAGVPVVASDLPAVRGIVTSNDVGLICDPINPQSVANAIRTLVSERPDERQLRRDRCRQTAVERYSWEIESLGLLASYRDLRHQVGGIA